MIQGTFKASDIKLKTHRVISDLIQPVSSQEYEALELNLIEYGCKNPIVVWNNYILDGHKRYAICAEYNIPFTILIAPLTLLSEAVSFVCENQLKRKDIKYERYKYLVGKWASAQKELGVREAKLSQQTDNPVTAQLATHERTLVIARSQHLALGTVNKYRFFQEAADKIAMHAPELGHRIISGNVRISHDNTLALSGHAPEDLRKLEQSVISNGITYLNRDSIRHEIMLFGYPRHIHEDGRRNKDDFIQAPIKRMPEYDPDAEVSSLAFTIPSWCNILTRTKNASNFSQASRSAKKRLIGQLVTLSAQADLLLQILKEPDNE